MTRPRIASAYLADAAVPCCPHCERRGTGGATIRLGDLVDAWDEMDGRVPVDADGYATAAALTIDCPHCLHPIAVRIDAHRIYLVAARTDADRRLLEGAAA